MTAAENISVMKRWYREVWREGKNEIIYEVLAPDASLHGQVAPDVEIKGPEGFIAFAENIRNTFPDTEITVEDIFAVDDKVVARWVVSGTHSGHGLGVPPSGERIRVAGVTIARFDNGKIVEGWDNWDRLGMLEQIGAYSPPAAVMLEKSG